MRSVPLLALGVLIVGCSDPEGRAELGATSDSEGLVGMTSESHQASQTFMEAPRRVVKKPSAESEQAIVGKWREANVVGPRVYQFLKGGRIELKVGKLVWRGSYTFDGSEGEFKMSLPNKVPGGIPIEDEDHMPVGGSFVIGEDGVMVKDGVVKLKKL